MRKTIQSIAVLLLISAVIISFFVIREQRRGRDYSSLVYTRSVKLHDIVDTARHALAALQDAEIREQNYVLTGETTYFEAYTASTREWHDEVETLALLAENDKALPLARELSTAGDRVAKELAAIVSLYDGGARDKALDRIRKGSGIVYLDQARDITGKILDVDDFELKQTYRLITSSSARTLRRAIKGGIVIFFLTLIAALLLIFGIRRNRNAAGGVEQPAREPAMMDRTAPAAAAVR